MPRPRLAERELPEPAIELPLRESFTLHSAGAAPRRLRRYALEPGPRRYALTATLRARLLTGETPVDAEPQPVPPFRESFVVEPAGRGPRLSWLGEPPHVEGAAAAAATAAPYLQRWKGLLAGRRATFALDARAMPEGVTFAEELPPAARRPERDELTQRLLGLAVPLPAEPIGRGASWTAVTVLRQGLGVVKQTARYELLEASARRLTLSVDVRRVGEEQRLDAPGLPAGASVELVALFRAITGQVELDLGCPLPVAGALTVEARAHQRLRLPAGGAGAMTGATTGTVTDAITEDIGALALSSEPVR